MIARLFRMPVVIEGKLESIPPPPEGPTLFGLSEAVTTVWIDLVMAGNTLQDTTGQNKLRVRLTAMRDDKGTVLSVGLDLRDREGQPISNASLNLDEPDARRIAEAVAAILSLTPNPPGDDK